jgi:hypothetical protein
VAEEISATGLAKLVGPIVTIGLALASACQPLMKRKKASYD